MSERDQACLVYVTTSGREEAIRIGRDLVERKLAACANIIAPTTAIYRWEGRIEEGAEAVIVAKTVRRLVGDLTEAVMALHGYELPCIVALDIVGGLPAFTDWIRDEVLPET